MDGITRGMCQGSYATREQESTITCMIVQSTMLNGMERVPATSSHVNELEVTDMKMCRWACGHTLRDHMRNDNITERQKGR